MVELAPKSPFDREKQFAAKRRKVILSAASAFRRRGYHNTSMRDIGEVLGLTKAALYYYVKNKEEILFESHLMAYGEMDEILKMSQTEAQSALDYLELIFRNFVKLLTQSGVSILSDVDSLSGERQSEILKRRQRIERAVTKIVKQGQADGSIRGGDARLHVFFFMGALNWLNVWYDNKGRVTGDEIANHFSLQLRRGIEE
ncbi:MAG: TetR/AcrR family transcriptional regulator [Maricaulaceae bacterium]